MPITAGNEGVGVQSVTLFSLQSFCWFICLLTDQVFKISPFPPALPPDCPQKHTLCPDSKLAIHISEDEKCPQTGHCTNVLIFCSPLPMCAVLQAPSVHGARCTSASAKSWCLPSPGWHPRLSCLLTCQSLSPELKGSWQSNRSATVGRSTPSGMI